MRNPQVMNVSSNPINKLANVHGKLWVCTNNLVKVLDPITDTVLVSKGERNMNDSHECLG